MKSFAFYFINYNFINAFEGFLTFPKIFKSKFVPFYSAHGNESSVGNEF